MTISTETSSPGFPSSRSLLLFLIVLCVAFVETSSSRKNDDDDDYDEAWECKNDSQCKFIAAFLGTDNDHCCDGKCKETCLSTVAIVFLFVVLPVLAIVICVAVIVGVIFCVISANRKNPEPQVHYHSNAGFAVSPQPPMYNAPTPNTYSNYPQSAPPYTADNSVKY